MASKRDRKRAMHRAIMARSRQRQREGRRVALVEVDGAIIDMLVRRGLLADGVSDMRVIAGAIARLLTLLCSSTAARSKACDHDAHEQRRHHSQDEPQQSREN